MIPHRFSFHWTLTVAFNLVTWIGAQLSVVHAVVINDDWFTASGGDVDDVAGTLDQGYADARAFSYQEQFLAVGQIPGCSCTWIGNDEEKDTSLFLTAAHCVEQGSEQFSINTSFTDWAGNVVASGQGTAYVPPERINPPAGFGGSSTDIALIELPGQTTILDTNGQPVQQPVLYDGSKEVGYEVSLAGYGSWGIGSQGSNGGLFPSSGPRRAGGTNVIGDAFEANHALTFNFTDPAAGNATKMESTIASGDSGSAWWQEHAGDWSIIATSCCGGSTSYGGGSNGTRVAKYIDWIEAIFPDVERWSNYDPTRVTISTGIDNNDQADGVIGQLFTTGSEAGALTHIAVERATSGTPTPDATYLHVYSDTDLSDGIDTASFLGSSLTAEVIAPTNGGIVYWDFDGTSVRLDPNTQYLFAFADSSTPGDTVTARVALHNGDGSSDYIGGFAPVDFSGRTDLNTIFDVFLDTDALTGVAGDVNQDGVLDSLDVDAFIVGWRSGTNDLTDFQKTQLGDLNFDGITSLADFAILRRAWINKFGGNLSLAGVTVVPEPGSLALVIIGGVAAVTGYRCRHRRCLGRGK